MTQRASAIVTIPNRLGLHARPAMTFVELAKTFNSTVHLCRGEQRVDGKSIMQIMMLAATRGTQLQIIAEGADASEACVALEDLVERGFDED